MVNLKKDDIDEDDKRKQEIIEQLSAELPELDCDDETILQEWAFDLNI